MLVMSGNFDLVHVRSCYACKKPYSILSEAASHQKEFKQKPFCTGFLIRLAANVSNLDAKLRKMTS